MTRIAGVIGCLDSSNLLESLLNAMNHDNSDMHTMVYSKEKNMIGVSSYDTHSHIFHTGSKDDAEVYDGKVYGLVGTDGFIKESIPTNNSQQINHILFSNGQQERRPDGMYSFAHCSKNKIELMRDDFGIKPLFWRSFSHGQVFASELPSIVHGDLGSTHLRTGAIAEFLAFGKVLGNATFYNEVYKVPPNGKVILEGDRYDVHVNPSLRPQTNVVKTQLRNMLIQSIQRCSENSEDIGLALSGGLDSTILAYELNKIGLENLTTISVNVSDVEDGVDNVESLELPGRAWSTWNHKIKYFSAADLPPMIEESIRILGEPTFLTSTPLYIKLAEHAHNNNIRTLLLGEGADELFAGYSSHLNWFQKYSLGDKPMIDKIEDFIFPPSRRFWVGTLLGEKWVEWCHIRFRDICNSGLTNNALRSLLNTELTQSLEPLLVRTDHCLMKYNIEGLTPYLHAGIPELSSSLDDNDLIRNKKTKVFLRDSWKNLLTARLTDIPKRPFRAPLSIWFSGPLADWLHEQLESNMNYLETLGFIRKSLDDLVLSTLKGDEQAANLSYAILSLLSWIKWRGDDLVI